MSRTSRGDLPRHESAVSERVVTAVATARGVEPADLPPLYDVIDPDALDRLFRHGSTAGCAGPDRVVFTMAGCEVVVDGSGEIDVTPEDESTPSSATTRADEQGEAETTFGTTGI